MSLPLAPYTVLDLTRARAGPTCVRQLADMGADVVQIESIEDPDQDFPRHGSDFQYVHRNKRSITLNLKDERGIGVLHALVERADVCVIGSGARGAVAAAELAAAGLSVVVLEQGHYWTAADFTQREEEMLPRLFEEAGMRQTVDGAVTILQGRNVGGSTVHNLCYCFRTPEAILRMWREEHGLSGLTPESLQPSFERVEKQETGAHTALGIGAA